jgi:hypothetical protein
VLLVGGAIEQNRPWPCLTTPVHPHETLHPPTSRRMVTPLSLWVGTCRRMVFARVADTVVHGRIHQPTEGHDQHQRHAARGLFQLPCSG